MKPNFENKEWAAWLEDCVKGLFEIDLQCMGMVAIGKDGVAQTAYYHAGITDKAVMKQHISSDILMDIIKANAGMIKGILEEAEDE